MPDKHVPTELRRALEYLRTILIYLSKANRQLTRKEVMMAIEQTLPEYTGETIAPFALEWIEEGRQEGRQEGAASIVVRLLNRRFGTIAEALEQKIYALTAEQLELLSDNAYDFATADDLAVWLAKHRACSS